MRPGSLNSITDINGLLVGQAHDQQLRSGVTVLTADEPFVASVHVMGGAPGTRETDLLAPDKTVEAVDALVLSGGSAFGLSAASGVADALRKMGRGFQVGDVRVPIVPAAILFDLLNGGDKGWGENPYADLGRTALSNVAQAVEIGTIGAGFGAMMANGAGGLGTASIVLPDGVTVAALVAANPVGSARTMAGHYWAAPFEINAEFGGKGVDPDSYGGIELPTKFATSLSATTIAIVATDAKLTKPEAHRMAVAAHDGIARAVVPSHTPFDGDLVFSVSHGEKPGNLAEIGHAAAICLARAIARGVYAANS